ncbi:glycosyltransferase family 4 protein [Marinimicrococcus flavescens]|uniref:Glycosyltransferase family 4 protein n=1 Tax=Marinimicrococcus flavescens TaxID=3031815 RepID=A0AAP3XRK1_9PROT|nr:glycosyltransferase family 4 protein [Marinimicrococcus flavescens]
MRVALLTNNRFPPREGIGRHVLELARRLRARGHEPLVLARGEPFGGWRHGVVEDLPVRFYPFWPLRPLHHAVSRRALQRWLDEGAEGAQVIHLHMPLFPPLRTALPTVVTFHSPMLADTAAIGEKGLRPLAVRLNARLVSRVWEQWHLERAGHVVAVSQGVREELARYYRLAREVELVPNGVDAQFFAGGPRRRPMPCVLYVGRLGYRKGLFRLLEALASLPPHLAPRLVLAGEGPLRARLEREAVALGLEGRVQLTGFLGREEIRNWLKRAACVVNPADYESGPLTLLEAMAAGAPVVSTRTGLVAEMGATPPLLVSETSAEGLARSIASCLADPGAARRRAETAQAMVRQRFAWDAAVGQLLDLYQAARPLAA